MQDITELIPFVYILKHHLAANLLLQRVKSLNITVCLSVIRITEKVVDGSGWNFPVWQPMGQWQWLNFQHPTLMTNY